MYYQTLAVLSSHLQQYQEARKPTHHIVNLAEGLKMYRA